MTFTFVKTDAPPHKMQPGQYRPFLFSSGKRGATVCCPDCGGKHQIGLESTIDDFGHVEDSVVCTASAHCKFHRAVRLDDYPIRQPRA